MATGTGIEQPRGGEVSNITPTFSAPNLADDWGRVHDTFARLQAAVQPTINQLAATKGAREGADAAKSGQPASAPLPLGQAGEARAAAYEHAYVAGVRTDIDIRDDDLRREHALDPEGYAKAAAAAQSTYIQAAPAEFAVDVENYARAKFASGHDVIARTAQAKHTEEAGTALRTRIDMAKQHLLGLAAVDGGIQSPDFQAAYGEYHASWATLVDTPDFAVPPEQQQKDEEGLLDGLAATASAAHGIREGTAAGGGLVGKAAAYRALHREFFGEDKPVLATARPAPQAAAAPPLNVDWRKPAETVSGILGGAISNVHTSRTAAEQRALIAQGRTNTPPERDEHVAHTAMDFHPPAGMSNQAAVESLVRAGFAFNQIVDEGDHIHIGWGGQLKGEVFRLINGKRSKIDLPPEAPAPPPEAPAMATAGGDAPADSPFSRMAPDRRARLYSQARQQIDDFFKADIEDQQVRDLADRNNRAAARESVGEWRLKVQLGEASERDIQAATDIEDGQKASLIQAARAREASAAADARRAEADDRRQRHDTYEEYVDQARAATLSDGDLADAVKAGYVSPGQAQTLRRLRSTSLKPTIDNIMAPVREAADRPGIKGIKPTQVAMARAEADAARWAEAYPNATLDDQIKAGKFYAERYFGSQHSAPGPKGAETVTSAKAVALGVLERERTARAGSGNQMGLTEYNARRSKIIHGD